MELVYTLPKLGGLPRLDTFRCSECGETQTVETKPYPRHT